MGENEKVFPDGWRPAGASRPETRLVRTVDFHGVKVPVEAYEASVDAEGNVEMADPAYGALGKALSVHFGPANMPQVERIEGKTYVVLVFSQDELIRNWKE